MATDKIIENTLVKIIKIIWANAIRPYDLLVLVKFDTV
jgi:hypothetical protein